MDRKTRFLNLFILLALLGLAACNPTALQTVNPTSPGAPTSSPSPIPQDTAAATLTPEATAIPTEEASGRISPQNAAEVRQLMRLGQGMINGAPFYSKDGELLVIPTTIGIDLYEAATLQKMSSIPALYEDGLTLYPDYPRLAAISPDRRILAANLRTMVFDPAGNFQEDSIHPVLYLWRVGDGSLVGKIPLDPESPLADLAFSPDGQTLAAGFATGKVQVWSAADGQERYSLEGSRLEFSPEGQFIVTMSPSNENNRQVYLYETASGKLLKQWEGQRALFSPNGWLAIERDGAVRLMDLEKGVTLRAFNGRSAAFSADGQRLALLDQNRIKLYQVVDGSPLQTMEGEFEEIYTLQFGPDGQTLAAVGEVPMCPNCLTTPRAVVWQVSDGTAASLEIQDPRWITYAPQEGTLVIWAVEGIHFLNPANATPAAVFDTYATSLEGIAFSPDGQTLAANSGQPHLTARLWGVADGWLEKLFEDPNNPGYGSAKVLFSPDGQFLWVQGSLWSAGDGERLTSLENILGKEAPPYVPASASFSPDGSLLAIGYLEGHLQVWDLRSQKLTLTLEGYQGELVDMEFSPDGKTLAAVYDYPDFIIQLWKIPEGERSLSIKGTEWTHEFAHIAFSPDGQTLVSVAKNEEGMNLGIAEVWRTSDGERLYQLDLMGALSAAFSPDGKTLATGSYDHTVRLWQAFDGTPLKTLYGHGDYVTDVAFSPSGELLASGSMDGTAILWGNPLGLDESTR